MQQIDLFSGIGGFSLAGDWAGWSTIQFCEIDKFCQRVLSYHWQGVPIHDDIKTFGIELILENPLYDETETTIITGGFPCQPYSVAGKRKGKEDDRHLWPEMLRVIKEIHPDWVVAENVPGLINWSGGLVFNEVQTDLENEGYEVQSVVLPACGVNAPHRRYRVWIVAHSVNGGHRNKRGEDREENGVQGKDKQTLCARMPDGTDTGTSPDTASNGCKGGYKKTIGEKRQGEQRGLQQSEGESSSSPDTRSTGLEGSIRRTSEGIRFTRNNKNAPDTDSSGRGQSTIQSELWTKEFEQLQGDTWGAGQAENGEGQEGEGWQQRFRSIPDWDNFPTQPPIRMRDDGFSSRLAGITFSKHRNESIKGYGNAIVPQIALMIFRAIADYENI